MNTETDNSMKFATMPMGKLIMNMSLPLIGTMLIQALYNLVDSVFVAKLGTAALNALGIAAPVQVIMIALSNGIGAGMNSTVTQRMGGGDRKSIHSAVGNAILLLLICWGIMAIFGIFGAGPFLSISTANAETAVYGTSYLTIVTVGSIGLFMSVAGERLLQLSGYAGLSMITHLIGCAFNIVFDPILIFGLLGFPALGVTGAAVATICGQVLSAVVAFAVCAAKKCLYFHFRDLNPYGHEIKAVLKVGAPVALSMGLSAGMSFGMNQILKAQEVGMAVYTAYYKLWNFVMMPLNGIVQATIPIMGYNFGAGDKQRVSEGIKKSVLFACAIEAGIMIIFELFASPLTGLFNSSASDPNFAPSCIRAIRIIAVTFIPLGFGQVGGSIFQGTGNGVPSLVYALLHQIVLLLPAAWFLLNFFGMDAVWFAWWFAEFVSLAIMIIIFRREYRSTLRKLA